VIPTSNLGDAAWVAVDSNGNIYIADDENNQILMETLSNGTYTQTVVTTSSLNAPEAVAVDALGNLYVADSGNSRILRETVSANSASESVISTSALSWPGAIWVDGYGNIFIADSGNNRILKETPSGSSYVETTVQSSALNSPYGVTTDSNGNIYIADSFNNRVLKEDLSDPPSLTFATTEPGSTSSDSPQIVTIENAGNAALSFPVPPTGNNPSLSDGFTLNSTGAGTCPLVTSGSGGPGALASGQSCALPISFAPTEDGTVQGTLVLTDNALNTSSTQSIQLGGTGGDGSQVIRSKANADTIGGTCSPPIITRVLPSTWFAGKMYHVTIMGANFSDSITTCRNPNGGGMYEGPTTLSVFTGSGAASISALTVVSQTMMTAIITPLSTDPTEPATVQAWAPFLDGPTYGPSLAPAKILGTPTIKWNGNPIVAATPQSIAVGQKVYLTTDVSSGAAISNKWTAQGTIVGNYNPSVNGAQVTSATTDQSDITFYWIYPGSSTPQSVTYSYCTVIAGIDPRDSNCSLPGTAAFYVNGVQNASVTLNNAVIASVDYRTGCQYGPAQLWLDYGKLNGPIVACAPPTGVTGTAGIKFIPNVQAPPGGHFFFVQIVNSDELNYSGTMSTASCTSSRTPGLDENYPYQNQYDKPVPDAPGMYLNPIYSAESIEFNATMYLMWQYGAQGSQSDVSIPVPLGYVNWVFNASAQNSTIDPPLDLEFWSSSGDGGPLGTNGQAFVWSNASQPNYGLPMWNGVTLAGRNCP
jgi:hypothetical protein